MLPGQNDLTSEIDIVAYLIDDIAHLPIISNRAQELWLGVPVSYTHLTLPTSDLV